MILVLMTTHIAQHAWVSRIAAWWRSGVVDLEIGRRARLEHQRHDCCVVRHIVQKIHRNIAKVRRERLGVKRGAGDWR